MYIGILISKVKRRLLSFFRKPEQPMIVTAEEDFTKPPTRVGIIGTGFIAGAIARTLNALQSCSAYAVASRTLQKAQQFAEEWGIPQYYGSYEELLKDPNVDLVYIAVPNSEHLRYAKLALKYGKSTIIEKTFTANCTEAIELIKIARERKLFLCEAVWTRFLPIMNELKQQIQQGIIGNIHYITIETGWDMRKNQRVMSAELCGGALMDVGIYGINIVRSLLGDEILSINSRAELSSNHIDLESETTFIYKGFCKASILSTAKRFVHKGIIKGENGQIEIDYPINPKSIKIFDNQHNLIKNITRPLQFSGYEYEFLACRKALLSGALECYAMPLKETLENMQIMDQCRTLWK